MASKKGSVVNVVVCGLTTSSFQGLAGQGAGKSYLCNRFVRPKQDDLTDHTSVYNNSDFGSNIINQDHFLYWGQKVVGLEDGQDVTFQLVEQTEFVDDATFKPFTCNKPYHKRCTQLKLQSGGKVMYISYDQLALPEEFTNVPKFPDKFNVDGFIVCADVSIPFDSTNPQKEFLARLLHSVQQSKKPVVIAMTKYDSAIDSAVVAVSELASKSKKQVPLIEVSALKNINVDVCFLVLCHLVDPKKPKTKLVQYPDAKTHLDERIRRIEESFQNLLNRTVKDFSQNVFQVCKELESQAEYELLLELKGKERISKLIRGQLGYLRKQQIEIKLARYVELLPLVLDTLLPQLSLNDNVESCLVAIRSSLKFSQYFVDVNEWRDDNDLLKMSVVDTVPYGLLLEEVGQEILQNHINKVLRSLREDVAFDKIRDVLCNAKGLIPGTKPEQLWEELGVGEEVGLVGHERLTKLYLEQMREVENESLADLKELLLERIALFDGRQESSQQTIDRIGSELKDCPHYKRLEHRPDVRKAQVLKYIGSVQVGERSMQARSHISEALERLEKEEKLKRESLVPPKGMRRQATDLQWNLYTDQEEYLNLALVGRTVDNVVTLRSDFMNHLSGNCMFESDGRSYRVDMSLFESESGPIETMTNERFIPDGAVAVVNSVECLHWLKDLLSRLWIPGDPAIAHTQPLYRGMPLVILALDKSSGDTAEGDTPLHQQAKALASTVQATCLAERPTDQPKRLVVSGVIIQLLSSLMDVVLPTASFFQSKLPTMDHQGLNVAVCTVSEDPYPAMDLLLPWLQHQAVCCDQGKLFVRSSLDKQLRSCTLTFHSALDIKEILSFTRLGFILVYSALRPASLACIKFLMTKLPNIPKMIIAIASDRACDNHMIEEGRELAEKSGSKFITTADPEWAIGCTSEFFSKCWFVRFSSWGSQPLPEGVARLLREKRQARALPSRPIQQRHSVSVLLDEEATPPTPPSYHSGTIPRSPVSVNKKPTSLPSPPVVPDSNIYSDPIAAKIGIKQMKAATLDRKKSSTSTLDPASFPAPILSPDLPDSAFEPEGDYATVSDALKLNRNSLLPLSMVNTLERQRRELKSPSMSPPPIPFSPTSPTDTEISVLDGGSDDEDESENLYDTVQTSRRSSTPRSTGYDHLEKSPEMPRRKRPSKPRYDHLEKPAIPPRGDSLVNSIHRSLPPPMLPPAPPVPQPTSLVPQPTPLESMYASVDLTAKTHRPRGSPRHNRHKSADTTLEDVGALYATVNKRAPATRPKPPPRRAATPDEPVYSVPDKRVKGRQSPTTPPTGMRTPPPVAPKPPKRSPTPTSGRSPKLAGLRAESFDAHVRTKPPLLPDLRCGRSFSMDKRPPIKSPIIPSRDNSFDIGKRTASLPRNYAHGVRENGHALLRSTDSFDDDDEEGIPSVPVKRYSPGDMDLDDAPPPLPPRIYNWSDFEDNDDELFQSEDELDDNKWTVSDQQKLYASITRASQCSANVGGVEAIYHVVNKMVLVEDSERPNVQVVQQSAMTQEEESAYDTLENVIKSIRGERHTPYSPTPSEGEQRGVVTPEPAKPVSPTGQRPLPVNQQQLPGRKSNSLTAGEIKNLQKTQKLLKRLEKQAKKEAARRQASEAKKRRREEEERRKKEGKKKKRGKHKQPERSRYFGSPLEKVADEGGVPVFVRKCVEFVEREGLKLEGIYRVPGKKENVLLLQDKFEEDQTLDLASLEMYETAVSSTLKAFFKVLPDPLIPESVAAQLLVVHSLDADSQKTRVNELLSTLPRPNLKTLKFMMEHLHKVQLEHEVNKMTPSNLSIVFWPTLMRPPLMDLADPSKQLGWQLIMAQMIERPNFIPDVN